MNISYYSSEAAKCPVCLSPCKNFPEDCMAKIAKRLEEEASEAAKYCKPR